MADLRAHEIAFANCTVYVREAKSDATQWK